MPDLRLCLVGENGRMGRQISTVADELGIAVGNALTRGNAATWFLEPGDVVVDFSSPEGFDRALSGATKSGTPFVSGTTGLTDAHFARLKKAGESIPVLWAANFSLGVNVLEHLVGLASSALRDFDAEVFEAHHRHKVDAPSGTALFLGEAVARARELVLDDVAEWGRQGAAGPRTDDEVGFQVVRGGSIVGEHTVFLCGEGERVELTHRALDRVIFARGAVTAARWLSNVGPGNYSMRDVLFG